MFGSGCDGVFCCLLFGLEFGWVVVWCLLAMMLVVNSVVSSLFCYF